MSSYIRGLTLKLQKNIISAYKEVKAIVSKLDRMLE